MREFQRTIHLVGADVIETLAVIALGQRLPVELGSLQEGQSAHHIGAGKGEGVLDTTVNMALGSQVNDTVDLILHHESLHQVEVANVAFHKCVVEAVFNIVQVGKVAGIGEFVEVDNAILWIFVDKESHHMRPYKAGPTGNDDIALKVHILKFQFFRTKNYNKTFRVGGTRRAL